MPVKKFLNDNGGIVAVIVGTIGIMGKILAVGVGITTNMSNIQLEQSKKLSKKLSKQFAEQQKQFTKMLEKIGKVDADSRVIDKDLELLIAKTEK